MTSTQKSARKFLPHPICLALPAMNADTFNDLVASMKTHGYDAAHPVILFQKKILDGRNRYRAAETAGVIPNTEEFNGTLTEAIEFVMRENVHRRHLTPGQKAMAANKMRKLMPATPESPEGVTVKQAAIINHVSPRTVSQADELERLDPKAASDVLDGKVSLSGALKKAKAKVAPTNPAPARESKDALGLPMNPLAEEALTKTKTEFEAVATLLRECKRRLVEMSKSDKGRLLNINAIATDFDNILNQIKHAKPYTSCPIDPCCDQSCQLCGGTQWIGEAQYASLPKSLKPVKPDPHYGTTDPAATARIIGDIWPMSIDPNQFRIDMKLLGELLDQPTSFERKFTATEVQCRHQYAGPINANVPEEVAFINEDDINSLTKFGFIGRFSADQCNRIARNLDKRIFDHHRRMYCVPMGAKP